MTVWISLAAMAAAAGFGWVLNRGQKKKGRQIPWIFWWLAFVLPFGVAGFHSYMAAITGALLLGHLCWMLRSRGSLRFCWNLNTAAVGLLVLFACLTPFWAVDRGMAVFGILRWIPVGLCALTLMQYPAGQRREFLDLVPLCGVVMTAVSCALMLIPGLENLVVAEKRLTGFMQYPNTFAAFLLAGLVLHGTMENRQSRDWLVDGVLVLGIVLSGSRTGIVLLAAALVGIAWVRREMKFLIALGGMALFAMLLAIFAPLLGMAQYAWRFATISLRSASLQMRFLYFKDALAVIGQHPFGLGYMGYRALEGAVQTGAYSTNYVHNGLLQLLLDVGWVPALGLTAAFLRAMFTGPGRNRLLLTVVLGHCMMDFDLQFLAIWCILLMALDWDSGGEFHLRPGKNLTAGICALAAAAGLWLGSGDMFCQMGNVRACLAVTPFHTDALTAALAASADTEEAEGYADRILALNESCSLAYSAKANGALSRGKVLDMIAYKERAIACARYAPAEYLDYFDKLCAVMQLYLQAGDRSSAAFCGEKLLAIPEMMEAVNEATDPIAVYLGKGEPLTLPAEYRQILEQLKDAT